MSPSNINVRKWSVGILFIIIIFIVCCLSSCSAEKRMSRLIKNNPQLVKTDTIWRKDTIYTKGESKDSSFFFYQTDTVVLKQDKLTVKYVFNRDSTVFISGKCDPDTVVKMYAVQTNSIELKPLSWWDNFRIWIFSNGWWIALIIFLLWKIFGKLLKAKIPFLN